MTRIMYDSVTVADLPDGGDLYAGYVNGPYCNIDEVRARFPGKPIVSIAVNTHADADVLDVEPHDAMPVEAPGWVQRQRARGGDPTVYCTHSAWPAVRAAFHQAGVVEPHYWIAHYDGKKPIPAAAVAKQYIDPPDSGGHYDISVVADHWPGVDPTPQEDDMFTDADRAKLDRLYDAHFTDHPDFGVTGIQKAITEIGYSVAGVDLPGKPSLIKRIAAMVKPKP